MKVTKNSRGFEHLEHRPHDASLGASQRLVQASSASGDDHLDRPGTSFLWLGQDHHLSRSEVRQLVAHLQAWLDSGSLQLAQPKETDHA